MQSWGAWPFSSYDPGGGYTILPSPWNIAWCQTLHKLHRYLVSGMYLWRTFGSKNIVSGKAFFNLYFTVLIFSVYMYVKYWFLTWHSQKKSKLYVHLTWMVLQVSLEQARNYSHITESKKLMGYEVYLILIVDQLCKSLCLRLWSSWVNAMRLILRIWKLRKQDKNRQDSQALNKFENTNFWDMS